MRKNAFAVFSFILLDKLGAEGDCGTRGLVGKYADYLIEIDSSWENNYSTLGYIHSKIYDSEENLLRPKQEAANRNWNLREVEDDLRLLRMMTDGTWNDREFLILKPGERIAPDYTGLKLKAEPCSE